jgi:hypothetical protein
MAEKLTDNNSLTLSRRDFNRAAAVATGVTVANWANLLSNYPQEAAHWLGSNIIDKLRQPETLMPSDGLHILIPRTDNTPQVESDLRAVRSQDIPIQLIVKNGAIEITLPETELRGKFSGEKLTAQQFSCVGSSVITSAEGLDTGKQEMCLLAINKQADVIAIGYEDGQVFIFNKELLEWEEAVTESTDSYSTEAVSHNFWQQFSQHVDIFQTEKLIEWVHAGNTLLQKLKYQPFSALRPDLIMPSMSNNINIQQDRIAQTEEDVFNYKEKKIPFMVTEAGMLLDLEHLAEKSTYVTSIWSQLNLLQLQRQQMPFPPGTVHDISVFQGTTSPIHERFHFGVDDSLLDTHSISDIVQMVMCLYTTATESIMQRDIVLAAQSIGIGKDRSSGMSPEDPYTNSASTAITLSILEDERQPISAFLRQELMKIASDQSIATWDDAVQASDQLYQKVADEGLDIHQKLLHWVIENWGLQPTSVQYKDLPLGLYHLIGMRLVPSATEIPALPIPTPAETKGVKITYLPDFSVSLPTALKEVKTFDPIGKLRKLLLGSK